ncbi:MAG: hypothetical protein EGR80_03170 [Ruminiclostridium sp.]|nr:hypothetical protein [Ruminiclostridium sp.]
MQGRKANQAYTAFHGERGQGDRDNKSEVYFKNILFLQTETAELLRLLFFSPLLEKPTEKCYNCKGLSSDTYVCRLEING